MVMNKEQYMKELKTRLKRLPQEEFCRAVEYYEEYFADAGAENEQQAIADLGTPEEAANTLIREFAIENARQPVKSVKKGANAVWVGILAVFALPAALPLTILWVVLALFLALVFLTIFLMVVAVIFAVVLSGPVSIFGGLSVITDSIPVALVCIGNGLLGIGVGLLLGYLFWLLGKKLLSGIVKLFGKAAAKGGERHEGR